MMCPATDNPAICESHAIICFLYAENTGSAVKILHELWAAVYDQNVISEGN
jgi:hypothetical protein